MAASLPLPCRRSGATTATLLLARQVLAHLQGGERILELGCGCGDGVLQVATSRQDVTVDGLEIQEELATIGRQRLAAANLTTRCHLFIASVATWSGPGDYHHVFCNPPFRRLGEGRLPPDPLRAVARFEVAGNLQQFLACGHQMLHPGGSLHLIHLASRGPEVVEQLIRLGFQPPWVEEVLPWRLFRARRPFSTGQP